MASPKYSLDNKVVAVVGCVSGIGLATVEILLKEKNVKGIALLDFNVKSGEELEKRLTKEYPSKKITFTKSDVTVGGDIEKAFNTVWKNYGTVDLLINFAGILDDKNWRRAIDINVTGLIESSLQGLVRMRKDRGGSGGTIINIASIAGLMPTPIVPIYNATKHAVRAFTTSLGLPLQYKMTGVRTLSICPDVTNTPLFDDPSNKVFDASLVPMYKKFLEDSPYLTPKFTASAILQAFEKGESASVWLITNNTLQLIPESSISLPESYIELPLQYEMTGVRTLTVCPSMTNTPIFDDPSNKMFDPSLVPAYKIFLENCFYLTPEFTAGALLQAYEKAESASVWLIYNNTLELVSESSISIPASYLKVQSELNL